jgi:DNA-binding transcriptional LysR family regulator
VTRLIHQLEARLGGQLIDRSKRPLLLTDLGTTYYEGCKRLLEQYAELEASIRRDHVEKAITVRVAAIYSVGLWDMGRYINRFDEEHPHAKIRIDYLHPNQVYERVLDGTADLGLVSFPRRCKELTVLPWREEEMVVACSPGHPIAGRDTVSPSCLDGEKFVAFDQGLSIRKEVDRFLRDQGVTVDVVLEFDNIENIKKGIEIGSGLALLPEPMIRKEREAGTLLAAKLEGCRMVRPLAIIHRRQHRPGTATQAFIEMLRAHDAAPTNGHVANGRRPSPLYSGERG